MDARDQVIESGRKSSGMIVVRECDLVTEGGATISGMLEVEENGEEIRLLYCHALESDEDIIKILSPMY